jgi:CheY-like chemotaxis protein
VQELARNLKGIFYMQAITTEPFFSAEIETEIREFRPDLIILDLLLSEEPESGLRVLRKIKTSQVLGHIPVLVSSKFINSTSSGRKWRAKVIEKGAVDGCDKYMTLSVELLLRFAKEQPLPKDSRNNL